MNPKNWDILSMANFPRFNPNNYWNVYKIIPIKEYIPSPELEENPYAKPLKIKEWIKLYYTKPVFVKNKDGNFVRFYADEAKKENKIYFKLRKENRLEIENFKRKQKYVYKNRFWFWNFKENNVVSTYEPGSVFKSFSVAIWLDSKEIEPFTKYKELWPIEIDTWTKRKQFIRTAEWVYRWIQTITNAIENSSNIWLAFIARKLWAELFYDYLINFNFSKKLWIEINWEQSWRMRFWRKWNEANLLTTSFWQWISTTPIQIITGLSALANWWELLKPRLIKKIIKANW
jgi:cell division protein FtsI/penicillin-binding protein 2